MTKPALLTRIDSPTDLRRLADEQLPQLAEELRAGTTILVKGSRFMRMERVAAALEAPGGERA